MAPSPTLPRLRAEFTSSTELGALTGQLRRFEIVTPLISGPPHGISQHFGCVHTGRCSVLLRVGGGHLRAPAEDLLARLRDDLPAHLGSTNGHPAESIRGVVAWLEHEQRVGYLERAYVTATILFAVSDAEVWAWNVGPNGVLRGGPSGVFFESVDLRYPVLRRIGVMADSTHQWPGTDVAERASSIFAIGTPAGYEEVCGPLLGGQVFGVLDRGCLPFGPLPTTSITLERLWTMEAPWQYGLRGQAVLFGRCSAKELALPSDWRVEEVPIATQS